MKRIFSLLAGLLLALTTSGTATATDVPMLLNYQGRLTDPAGAPKDGTFSMTFGVYDAEAGGNPLPSGAAWTETQNITVTDGVFNVLLGSATALPANLFADGPSDPFGPLRFLQIAVDPDGGGVQPSEVLSPRRRIASSAYAIASRAAGGSGAGASGRLLTITDDFGVCTDQPTPILSTTIPAGALGSAGVLRITMTFAPYAQNQRPMQFHLSYGGQVQTFEIEKSTAGLFSYGGARVDMQMVAAGTTRQEVLMEGRVFGGPGPLPYGARFAGLSVNSVIDQQLIVSGNNKPDGDGGCFTLMNAIVELLP